MLMLIKKNTVFLTKIEWFMKRCFVYITIQLSLMRYNEKYSDTFLK